MARPISAIPSPFGSVIPSSSTHSRQSSTSSRSTTPDSVFSDGTRLSVTPYRNPFPLDAQLAALETPIRPRHKTRKTRQKPKFREGITAYPLTFPDPRDVYTFHSDAAQLTELLDREHRRLAALPDAVFTEINRHAYPLDPEAEKRIGYWTAVWSGRIEAKQERLFAREAFPVVHADVYAPALRHFSTIYVDKLSRQSRTDRHARAPPVPAAPAVQGGRLGFTKEEQATYEQIVKWKGGLPVNMEQYAQWRREWGTMQVEQRAGRTALGARRTSSSSTITTTENGTKTTTTAARGGAGKRKRSELTIDVGLIPEESHRSAQLEAETPVIDSPTAGRRPEKKRRNNQKARDGAEGGDEANETNTGGVASAYFSKQQTAPALTTAPIMTSTSASGAVKRPHTANPTKSTSRTRTKTAEPVVTGNVKSVNGTPTRLGFTVAKRSMTSSCSSAEGMDKPSPLASPVIRRVMERGLVSAGSLDEQLLELERPAVVDVMAGSGIAGGVMGMGLPSAASFDDELMRLVSGSSPGVQAPEERFVTAPSTLAVPSVPQASIAETIIATGIAATETVAAVVDAVMDDTPNLEEFGAEYWNAAHERKAAAIERARRRSTQRQETSDEESQGLNTRKSTGNKRSGYAREDERDVGDSPKGQIFPSLSFPNDLATSTPKAAARNNLAGNETTIMLSSPRRAVGEERTAMTVSSPHRPVWETESYPAEPNAKPKELAMIPTQDDEPMGIEPPVESIDPRQPTESYNDLTGLMDDLTHARTTQAGKPGWNVTSSPPPGDDGASLSAFGQSQQIQRMGAGAMRMTSDLLGQEMYE